MFFYIYMAKKQKNGNTTNSQAVVEKILNINSYNLIAQIEIKSNKNENKYIIKQEYKKPNYSKQEVIEPTNIAGVKIIRNENNLILENSRLNLSTIYENYEYLEESDLDLITFIEEYKTQEDSRYNENEDEIKMITKDKVLYIDKKTAKPTKLQVNNNNKKIVVYILYKEVEINN